MKVETVVKIFSKKNPANSLICFSQGCHYLVGLIYRESRFWAAKPYQTYKPISSCENQLTALPMFVIQQWLWYAVCFQTQILSQIDFKAHMDLC